MAYTNGNKNNLYKEDIKMEKYQVVMKNNKTRKEVYTQSWKLSAINEWIEQDKQEDYVVTYINFVYFNK